MSGNVKQMLFKEEVTGTSKKTGEPYRMIVLHDPETLDNISFFIDQDSKISVTGLKLKDKVNANFEIGFKYGKPQMLLNSLTV